MMQILSDFRKAYSKEGTNQLDPDKIIVTCAIIIVTVCIIIYTSINREKRSDERNLYARYTIGWTTEGHNNFRSSDKIIYYQFIYKNNPYNGKGRVGWIFNDIKDKGGRYFVKFSEVDPENSEMLFDHPVPKYFLVAPDTGWASIPIINP